MGVISFRVPQEGLDQFSKAVDLITLIREIATNPNIGKTIDELSKKLADAQSLSEQKIKEAQDAEEIIAQANEAIDDLNKARTAQETKNKSDLADMAARQAVLQISIEAFAKDKLDMKNAVDKAKGDAQATLDQAQKLSDDAKARQSAMDISEKDLAARIKLQAQAEADFEDLKKQAADDLSNKIAAYQLDVQKLADDKALFELRKKKFEDALKG